jgi:hypothetical protein
LNGPFPSGSTVKLVLAGVAAVLVLLVVVLDLAGEVELDLTREVVLDLTGEVVGRTVAWP